MSDGSIDLGSRFNVLKVYVATNGCEAGRLASAYVEQLFMANNSIIVGDSAEADLVLFFACGLTAETENDSFRVIEKLKSKVKQSGGWLYGGVSRE